jgi:proline iminopeptidase
LRNHLGLDDWIVMGGSWGSLLALYYAIKHPDSVAGIIIRGIFLGRQFEIDWIHKPNGAALIYPEEWERYAGMVPGSDDIVAAYCKLLSGDDAAVAHDAAKAWTRWEGSMVNLFPDPEGLEESLNSPSALSIAHIESHFTAHNFFLESDNYILDNAAVIADIPMTIVHGRYDTICPPISAWELHKALPKSELVIVPDGAHSPVDGGMTKELVKASDVMRDTRL